MPPSCRPSAACTPSASERRWALAGRLAIECGEPQPHRGRHQGPQVALREPLGALLGHVATERVIQPEAGRDRDIRAVRPVRLLAQYPADRITEVKGAAAEAVGEIVADDRGDAPRP